LSFTILDHGAKRKRAQLRRIIADHHVTEQIAKAAKRKGAALTSEEKRNVSERSREALERRGFFENH
jgi:hypothetical protein